MEKATVLMRADDGRESGLGHVSRCVGLSQELVARGHVSVFVTTTQNRSAYEIILRHPPRLIEVDDTCDVESLLSAAREIGTEMVVVDSYLLELDAFQELADAGLVVVAIDDLGRNIKGARIVINHNHGAPKAPGGGFEYLVGEKYFICRKPFENLHAVEKRISEKVKNVLVAPGGRDRCGMADLVTRALATEKGLRITLIRGPRDDVSKMGNVEIASNPQDLAGIMAKADIAFAGGGVTKYELAAAGTPTLLFSQVPAQEYYCLAFENLGTSRYLGFVPDVNEQQVRESFQMLAGDFEARKLMSQQGKRAVDARGASRIVDRIEILLSRD